MRLSGALAKLVEEDPGLSLANDVENLQMLISGQGDGHVRLAIERLKRRSGVDVTVEAPRTPYRETIASGVNQRGRHKKQSGGHGQFADVTIEVRPLPRGSGFRFASKVTGGAVPRQWIPAVEQGVKDGLAKGPLGFPVVDLEVTLLDGQFHAVDSSEMAFRIAGRITIEEALPRCGPKLLEPIERQGVFVPTSAMSAVNSALSARRGQILGFGPREGWPGWRADRGLPAPKRAPRTDCRGPVPKPRPRELRGQLRSHGRADRTAGPGGLESRRGGRIEVRSRVSGREIAYGARLPHSSRFPPRTRQGMRRSRSHGPHLSPHLWGRGIAYAQIPRSSPRERGRAGRSGSLATCARSTLPVEGREGMS